jgi:hypothetical protein
MANQNLKISIGAIDNTRRAFASVSRGLNAIRKSLFNFKTGIAAALGAGGLGLLVKNSLDGIDKISKLSRTLGISVEDLRKLELAANLSGVELNTLARGVRTLNKGMVDFAREGTGEAADAFETLGITADDINAVMGDQFKVLELVAKRLDEVENSAVRSSVAQELFGGRASELLLVLENGGKELAKISKEAKTFGLILSTQAAQGVEEANDSVTRLFSVFKGLTDTITAALAPAITHLANLVQGKLINAMGGGENAVSNFGKRIAGSIIDAVEQSVQAFVVFINETGKMIDGIREKIHQFQRFLGSDVTPEEYAERVGKIKSALEGFAQATAKSAKFKGFFDSVRDELDDLTSGAVLSAAEINVLRVNISRLASEFNVPSALIAGINTQLGDLANKSDNLGESFKPLFSEISIGTEVFDELRAAMNQAPPVIEETGNQAKRATPKVLGLVEAAAQASLQMKEMQRSVFGATVPFHVLQDNIDQTDSFFVAANDNIKATTRSIADLAAEFEKIDAPMQEARESLEKVGMTMDEVKMRGIDRLEDALVGLVTGTKSASQAFKDMARSILADLARIMIQQQITLPLAQAMGFNVAGARAMGGPVTAGRPYLVGEKGPEIVVPGRNSAVVPNNQMGGGGVTVNQTINLSTGVSDTVRAEVLNMLPQIQNATTAAVLDTRRRGGGFATAFGG